LADLVKKYFHNHYSSDVEALFGAQKSLAELAITEEEKQLLMRHLGIIFLGHLVGLPTLNSILSEFGINSHYLHNNLKKAHKKLSTSKLISIFESVFEAKVQEVLTDLCKKDSSIFSKKNVTLVLDDSIFKQWLGSAKQEDNDLDKCYGSFFSGQHKSVVSGFKVLCLGVCIDGVVYPLYFDFVRKEEKQSEIAEKLAAKWGKLVNKMKVSGAILPKLALSCDSGYSDLKLLKSCENNHLTYISVPKKSHLIEYKGDKISIEKWIAEVYLVEEKAYLADKTQKEPFSKRFRLYYNAFKQEVTFLAFRLNGSKKVSVIYTDDRCIFSKSLRHHWFDRTYIEQFFKTMKHVLKIQETRTDSLDTFSNKLLLFFFMAFHVQKIIKFIRSKIKEFNDKGFIYLQRLLKTTDILDLLQEIITVKSSKSTI
jgi:hypothetical protein